MFTIYGTSTCSWCERAKRLLDIHEKDYIFLNIEEAYNWESYKINVPAGTKTVPQIFYDKDYIGGYEALAEYLK